MQTLAVFATILAAASAATVINSQRLGGSFAYSTSEQQLGLISSPVLSNVVSPIQYSAISQVPVSTLSLNGLQLVSQSGVPVVAGSQLGNVALVRSSDGALISGVQNVVVPATATSTVVSNVGTPAATAKVSQVQTPITLSSVGVVPVSSLGSVVLAKK